MHPPYHAHHYLSIVNTIKGSDLCLGISAPCCSNFKCFFCFVGVFFMKTTCIAVIVVYQEGLHQNYHVQGFHQTAIKICPRLSKGKSTPFPTPVLCRSRALAPVYHPFTFRIQLESIGSRPDINPCRGMPTTSQSKVTFTLP